MKKLICALLALMLMLGLSACGGEAEQNVAAPNMESVFQTMAEKLPSDAAAFDSDYVFDAYGVKAEDCKQQVVMSYYDGAVTAEIWLIEAVSAEALESIKQLAQSRLDSMCEQFQSYDPKAYALAEAAQLYTEGNCLVLIVAEDAQAFLDIYKSAQ